MQKYCSVTIIFRILISFLIFLDSSQGDWPFKAKIHKAIDESCRPFERKKCQSLRFHSLPQILVIR